MRAAILIMSYLVLCLADAATTVYLAEHFPDGMELNPFIDSLDWFGLLLAPVKLIIYGVFIFLVVYSEINRQRFLVADWWSTNTALAAYIVLFMLMVKVLAILNNLMPMMGISTPISYVLMFMEPFPGDRESHYTLFWSGLFLLTAAPGLLLVRHFYTSPGERISDMH